MYYIPAGTALHGLAITGRNLPRVTTHSACMLFVLSCVCRCASIA